LPFYSIAGVQAGNAGGLKYGSQMKGPTDNAVVRSPPDWGHGDFTVVQASEEIKQELKDLTEPPPEEGGNTQYIADGNGMPEMLERAGGVPVLPWVSDRRSPWPRRFITTVQDPGEPRPSGQTPDDEPGARRAPNQMPNGSQP
jgi:hypothetical protein